MMFTGSHALSGRAAGSMLHPVGGVKFAQFKREFTMLLDIYKQLEPQYVVEIGTWHGGSLWFWLHYAVPGAHVVSIDRGPLHWRPAEPDFDTSIWQGWVKPETRLHVLTGDSQDPAVITQVLDLCPQIDFLFIDGDHSYKGARTDFEVYGPRVRKGGVIAFHDLIPPKDRSRIQVGKLFREIQQAGYLTRELYSMPNQACMGIGVVYV